MKTKTIKQKILDIPESTPGLKLLVALRYTNLLSLSDMEEIKNQVLAYKENKNEKNYSKMAQRKKRLYK